jgi:succinylglutamic semialdehyde dehydrogenase
MAHASLQRGESNHIAGVWEAIPGAGLVSRNPARPERVIFSAAPEVGAVARAVAAARAAQPAWAGLGVERRAAVLRAFAALAKSEAGRVAEVLCDEVGKVMWEAKQEAGLLAGKVDITLEEGPESGRRRVSGFAFALTPERQARCAFRPHGVVGVLGPFNFPVHLPNGHIVPALLMGNTVVFKPSDKAPACGQVLVELFARALEVEGVSIPGVINLVHGGAAVAAALAGGEGLDAVAFTGSWPVGRAIMQANLDRPGRLLALEMGGNNAAVVLDDADLHQAGVEIVRCAFNTTGQRCTCTRRAIIQRKAAAKLLPAIAKAASNLIVGDPRSAHPVFCGPIISEASRRAVIDAQRAWAARGARTLVPSDEMRVPGCEGGWFLSPGVTVVDRFHAGTEAGDGGEDREVFGPLLRVSVVDSLDEAIEQANATGFGLAASIFSRDARAVERFVNEARAGCVNVNTGTAGASSKLPFGGLGFSGNHRPAGSFSLDYCAYPVAMMIEQGSSATVSEGMRFEASWLS